MKNIVLATLLGSAVLLAQSSTPAPSAKPAQSDASKTQTSAPAAKTGKKVHKKRVKNTTAKNTTAKNASKSGSPVAAKPAPAPAKQ